MRYLIIVLAILALAMPVGATSPEPVPISAAPSPYLQLVLINLNQDDFPIGWESVEAPQVEPSAAVVANHLAIYAQTAEGNVIMASASMMAVVPENAVAFDLDKLMPAAIEGFVKRHQNVQIATEAIPSIGDVTASFRITSTIKTKSVSTSMIGFVQFDTFVIVTVISTTSDFDTMAEAIRVAQIIAARLTAYQYPSVMLVPTATDTLSA